LIPIILSPQLIALIYGNNWFIFKPDVPADHEEYELRILMRQHQFFGPYPASYSEIANGDALTILNYVMGGVPPEKMKPFERITEREVSKEDKAFLLKIMRLDPRERPTAKQLMEDEWFKGD
jgi:serine/threonine protein kinase